MRDEKKPEKKPLYVELHALRSYPPSNLNRDDLGSPKSIVFGGERRVRVSSQCLKRTWRMSPFFRGVLAEEQLGVRTKLMPQAVFEKLGAGYDDKARKGLEAVFAALGKKAAKDEGGKKSATEKADDDIGAEAAAPADGEKADDAEAALNAVETKHLLFVSQQKIDAVVGFATTNKVELQQATETTKKGAVKVKSEAVKKLKKSLDVHIAKTCARNAVDIALFGAFMTEDEDRAWTTDAALQVAHALGTQKLDLEYDYFTAVDDCQPAGETGAGHLGETELCASVLYEYAVCDVPLLVDNLGGDVPLAARAMKAIALAMCRSIFEKAKKNGTAPHTPADFLEVVIRRDAPMNLANAFLKPVRVEGGDDVMEVSIKKLRAQATTYDEAYPETGVQRFRLDLRDATRRTHVTLAALAEAVQQAIEVEAGR